MTREVRRTFFLNGYGKVYSADDFRQNFRREVQDDIFRGGNDFVTRKQGGYSFFYFREAAAEADDFGDDNGASVRNVSKSGYIAAENIVIDRQVVLLRIGADILFLSCDNIFRLVDLNKTKIHVCFLC